MVPFLVGFDGLNALSCSGASYPSSPSFGGFYFSVFFFGGMIGFSSYYYLKELNGLALAICENGFS